MTVKERILAIRLSEKLERQEEFARQIGVECRMKNRDEGSISPIFIGDDDHRNNFNAVEKGY